MLSCPRVLKVLASRELSLPMNALWGRIAGAGVLGTTNALESRTVAGMGAAAVCGLAPGRDMLTMMLLARDGRDPGLFQPRSPKRAAAKLRWSPDRHTVPWRASQAPRWSGRSRHQLAGRVRLRSQKNK